MDRLIDAFWLKNAIEKRLDTCVNEEFAEGLAGAIDEIDGQPTVDAIPVSWLEGLHKTAQSEEADRMIDEIISLWEARKK